MIPCADWFAVGRCGRTSLAIALSMAFCCVLDSRAQPNAETPPYAEDLFAIPRAGHGGFQRFIFWRVDPDRMKERYAERETRRADELRQRGVTPTFSIMHWRTAYADARPGSGQRDATSPAHQEWFAWMRAREDMFWVRADGQRAGTRKAPPGSGLSTAHAWIAPQRPLDPDDPDRDESAGVLTWGDWFNAGLADYAARVAIDGVSLADHFDQLPFNDVTTADFQPAIVDDFAARAGVTMPGGTVAQRASHVLEHHFPAWIDYWNQAYADWYGDLAERLEAATGRPAVVRMQKHTHIHDKRYHAIDARLIVEAMPDDATLAYQVEAWSIPWNRGVGGDTLAAYMGMVGTHLCREPAMTRGVMMPMAQGDTPPDGKPHPMSVWRTVREYAKQQQVELDAAQVKTLGDHVLDTAWLTLPWVHLATRDGRVERAAQYVQRQFDDYHPRPLWEDFARPIVPTAPFGPALYYPASLERKYEADRREYHPVASLVKRTRGHATPAYFVSDAALDALTPDAAPSAWLVDDLAKLPADERRRLEAFAPVYDLRDLADAPMPLRFSSNGTGFGFIDQQGRTIVVVTRDRLRGPRSQAVTVRVELPTDGRYVLRNLREPGRVVELDADGRTGRAGVTLEAWETAVFALTPAGQP